MNTGYNGKYTEESVNMKFHGLKIDNHLNLTNHTNKLIPKLSEACYAVCVVQCERVISAALTLSNQFILSRAL
jgi:hypothetical protein